LARLGDAQLVLGYRVWLATYLKRADITEQMATRVWPRS
jgi:hypothetical protein